MCTPLVVWSHQHCLSAVDAATGSPKHCRCAPLIVRRHQHCPYCWVQTSRLCRGGACRVYSANSLEPAAAPCSAEQTFPTRYPGACRVYSANSSRNQHCLQCSGTAAILLRKACLCTALIVRGRQRRRVGLSKRPRRGVQGPAVCTPLIVRGRQRRRVGLRKRLDAVSRGLPCVLR